jgi:hypothetical protein
MNYSQDIIWIMIRDEIMINNNLNVNLNPTVSLNSINYKSNQHQESFPYELDKIHPKMLHRDGMVIKMMKVVMMMIPMKPSSMMMTMARISPSRKEFPRQISAYRRAFSLCVFRPTEAAESISDPPPSLLWTPSRVRKNRNFSFCFVQFREYFMCNFSETQKQQKIGNWHCGISLIG